jgi:hypothetical protein
MRHGLQAWDVMHHYLPWRSRTDLRATLCRTVHKQAIGEYMDLNADPMKIRQDNELLMAKQTQGDWKVKCSDAHRSAAGTCSERRKI